MAHPQRGTSPEITPGMRASARANPNTWLYVIDPAFDEDEDVPPWGVVGAYPVNEQGEIEEEFQRNTEYRPSPTVLGMPVTANELERLLQLIKTGHCDQAELLPALLNARLLLYAGSTHDRSVTGFPGPDGTVMVPACTSAAHIPTRWPGWRQIAGYDLARLLHGHPLVINPNGPITALIPAEHLAGASGMR